MRGGTTNRCVLCGEMINQYQKEAITPLKDMPTNICFVSNDEGID
jgi:hypothetical protein